MHRPFVPLFKGGLCMPSYVIPEKCDGCKALDKTACQYICPNDLMVLNRETISKAFNQRARNVLGMLQCCVKICPTQAPWTFAAMPTSCPWAHRLCPSCAPPTQHHVDRQVPQRYQVKRFKFPIRTTEEGKADPNGGFEPPDPMTSMERHPLHGARLHSECDVPFGPSSSWADAQIRDLGGY